MRWADDIDGEQDITQRELRGLTAEERSMKVSPKDHKLREQIQRERELHEESLREMEDTKKA